MSFLKKIKRKIKKEADKEFQKTLNMYTNLPKECGMCQKEFDKDDKDMLKTWNITVKKTKGEANLYCPECWGMAMAAVKEGFQAAMKEGEKDNE